jgi:hypothetical protein
MPSYLYVGWLGLPGLLYVLWRRSEVDFLNVLCAVGGVAFAAIAILAGWGFSGVRYPLMAAVCLWLVGMASFDVLLAALANRRRETGRPAMLGRPWLSLTIPLAAWLVALPQTQVLTEISRHLAIDEVQPRLQRGAKWNRLSRRLCESIAADAIVASANPWSIYYWCGNAGYLLPEDLTDLHWLHMYLDEFEPDYVIATRSEDIELFSRSPRLELVEEKGPAVLYEAMSKGEKSERWQSLGPLHDLLRNTRDPLTVRRIPEQSSPVPDGI